MMDVRQRPHALLFFAIGFTVIGLSWYVGLGLRGLVDFPIIVRASWPAPVIIVHGTALGGWLISRGRRRILLPTSRLLKLDMRGPLLLLRPFESDSRLSDTTAEGDSFEASLVAELWSAGPVITLSNPSVQLPPEAAVRENVRGDWRVAVQNHLKNAEAVIVILGPGAGLNWELKQIAELDLAPVTTLVLPPGQRDQMQYLVRGLPKPFCELADVKQLPLAARCTQTGELVLVYGYSTPSGYALAVRLALLDG